MRKTEAEYKETCHLRGFDSFRITMKETDGTAGNRMRRSADETDIVFW